MVIQYTRGASYATWMAKSGRSFRSQFDGPDAIFARRRQIDEPSLKSKHEWPNQVSFLAVFGFLFLFSVVSLSLFFCCFFFCLFHKLKFFYKYLKFQTLFKFRKIIDTTIPVHDFRNCSFF